MEILFCLNGSVYTGADRFCAEAGKRSGITSVYSGKRTGSFRNAKGLQICTEM